MFGFVLLLSLTSVLLTILSEDALTFGSVLGFSIVVNLWALYQNSQGGFVRSRQIWRADEPPRRLDNFQVFIIYLLIGLQGATAFLKLL